MYTCKECGKKYTRKDSMLRHVRTHMPDRQEEEEPVNKLHRMEDDDSSDTSEVNKMETSYDDIGETSEGDSEEDSKEDVWKDICEIANSDHNGDILQAYIAIVKWYRIFKKDDIHQQVMETVNRYRSGKDDMDFNEALLNAVKKRQHLLLRMEEPTEKSDSE